MERALALLARRDHGRDELELKLARYQPTPAMVTEVLTQLGHRGLLDDRRFARQVAASMERSGSVGPRRIAARLNQRRLHGEVVTEALSELDADWKAVALDVARRWRQSHPALDLGEPRHRARLIRFLQGRGFGPDAIFDAVDHLLRDEREG